MAQAARLCLRMQKELKLLLTDPPPGASFPFLSNDSDLSPLTSIDAQIEGPEGTVYAKGFFHIKIQIPERYPFQPPIVTFATPIYHPNIDSGGRICLDILNLPPKGAWQPSLNISTVLTSIGLLLSEPNPDDGLMCEASREYKYNRQVFDQKARAMTEKFAKAGAGLTSCSTQYIQSDSNPSTMEMEGKGSEKELKQEVEDFVSSNKKPCGIGRKLSLEPSSSTHKIGSDGDVNNLPNHHLLYNSEEHIQTKGNKKELSALPNECNLKYANPSVTRKKLSLASSVQIHDSDTHSKQDISPELSRSPCKPQRASVDLASPVLHTGNCNEQRQHQQNDMKSMICSRKNKSLNKLCHVSQKWTSRSSDICEKGDDRNEERLVSPELLPSRFDSNLLPEALPMPFFVEHNELRPCQDSVSGMENGSINTRCNNSNSVSKRLSLGFKVSSQGQEKDEKENILSVNKLLPLPNPLTPKNSGGPLTQLQRSNEVKSQLLLPSKKLSADAPEKQQSKKHQSEKVAGVIKASIVESPAAESVIVLDSEDSEEEGNRSVRSKLSLVRKRMAKRKSQA